MIDCNASDSMIEICGMLDESNTLLKFRCMIFRSFYSIELLQTYIFLHSLSIYINRNM